MRAVYQSTQAYLSLSYYDVNNYSPAMSDGYYDKKGLYHNPHVVGSYVKIPTTEIKLYSFREGEKHNQLTLTDPTEIRNMRAYIKRRGALNATICEILFDGDEAELEECVVNMEQADPVKRSAVVKGTEQEDLSDWDKKILSNMVRR